MSTTPNPHAALVEALRKDNGFFHNTFADCWHCPVCAGGWTQRPNPPIGHHRDDCPVRLALEASPPPAPKLTPLPEIGDSADYSFAVRCWFDTNRPALEAIIAQQENTVEPHNTITTPSYADIERLEKRINQHESGTDEYGNPLSDTFADRLRHVERKVFQLETEQSQRLGSLLEARNHTDKPLPDGLNHTGKPKCEPTHHCGDVFGVKCNRCLDTKIIKHNDGSGTPYDSGWHRSLCPCVEVGDVVSAEVANLLPVGSRIWWDGWRSFTNWKDGEWYWEKTESEWRGVGLYRGLLKNVVSNNWTIIRIGPAPEATTGTFAAQEKSDAEFIARCRGRTPIDDAHTKAGDGDLYIFLEGKKIPMLARFVRPGMVKELAGASCDYQLFREQSPADACVTELDRIDTSLHESFYAVPPCTMASTTDDHLADASKKVEPDRAEEIARECFPDYGDKFPDAHIRKALADVLRKHHVGQPPPLADLIADPRLSGLRGVFKVLNEWGGSRTLNQRELSGALAALSPELRASIEAVK